VLQVNAGESIPITATFETVPSSAFYFVWDYVTESKLVPDTTLSGLALVNNFEVPPAGTVITDNTAPKNRRAVIVTANYGGDSDKKTVTLKMFEVINIT